MLPAPLVTVVVPCYNYGRFLPEALESVLAQTLVSWECIIVDDGSSDDSPQVAEEYSRRDSRFRLFRQENGGPSAARNVALRNSTAGLVQFLDADDILHPRKLEEQVNFLEHHREVEIVYGPIRFFRTENRELILHSIQGRLSSPMMAKVTGNAEALRKLMHYNITNPIAPLTRRSAIDRAGLFAETVKGVEDWDLWLRCAVTGARFAYSDYHEALGLIRTHEGSVSRNSEGMLRALIAAAHHFRTSPAAASWSGDGLPLIYEMMLGIEDVEQGRRRQGRQRILSSARRATEKLTAVRWRVYSLAAAVLPRHLFMRFVRRQLPEWGLELYRRLSRHGRVT
jgi:glycosyltransferase involved in cell wall biosynthesis